MTQRNVRLTYELLSDIRVQVLPDAAFRSLLELVHRVSTILDDGGDGSLPDNDRALARLSGCHSLRVWRRVRSEIDQFFVVADGLWRLKEPWIEVGSAAIRPTIPAAIRSAVNDRHGPICTYCGTDEGPFDIDHILPLSRGGTNDPSNLTLACATCNRSKGAKTLREWRA